MFLFYRAAAALGQYSREYIYGDEHGQALQFTRLSVIPEIVLHEIRKSTTATAAAKSNAECFMGLFGSIGRAWLTVGNCLYMWSFEGTTGRDFTCYTKSSYEIIDVALVSPVPGVFVDSIKWVLVLSTPVEIVLLAVELSPAAGDLILHETDLRFPTDEVNILAVTGCPKTGRIFASGSDGNIYELVYDGGESGSWFPGFKNGSSRKCRCRKINRTSTPLSLFLPTFLMSSTVAKGNALVSLVVDPTRNLLWALGEDSSIRQYWLGPQGSKDFQLITHLSPSSFLPAGKNEEIVGIFAVTTEESIFLTLTAVGRSGQRYYFGRETAAAVSNVGYTNAIANPSAAQSTPPNPSTLLHIRGPPEENRVRDQKKLVHRWSPSIHAAFYRDGICLTAARQSADEDALMGMILNPSSGALTARIRLPLEYSFEHPLDGKVWAISEITSAVAAAADRRCFAVLTNVGVYLYTQMRSIDQLAALLSSPHSLPMAQLERFFDAYGPERACSLCISLCIGGISGHSSVVGYSSGGNSTCNDSVLYANALAVLLKLGGMPRLFNDGTAAPTPQQQQSIGRIISTAPEFINSPLHDGLFAFFSQCVNPLWKQSIWLTSSENDSAAAASIAEQLLFASTKAALYNLFKFLTDNGSVFTEKRLASAAGDERLIAALERENESINALKDVISLSLEVLAFLSIASDYRLLQLLRNEPIAREFSDACLEMLSTQPRGRALLTELGGILIQRQLKLRVPTRPLCEALRARCPSLFSPEDVNLQEALECLDRASHTRSLTERAEWITEAMNCLLSAVTVPSAFSLPTLLSVFDVLDRLHFQDCTLRLGLAYCDAVVVVNGGNGNGSEASMAQAQLQSVYGRLMDSLASCGFVPERTDTAQPGIDEMRSRWLGMAVNSANDGFLGALYSWLLTNRFVGTLLDLPSSAALQAFLLTDFPAVEEPRRDLLWKWLVKRGRFAEAAAVLYQLASCLQIPLNLSQRIEYLSLAMTNCLSASSAVNSAAVGVNVGDFSVNSQSFIDSIGAVLKPVLVSIAFVEEALEVASLQLEVLQEAQQKASCGGCGAVSPSVLADLDGAAGLLGVTELFNDFARPLKLTEASLKLLHTSGLVAPVLVSQLWMEWKETFMTTTMTTAASSSGGDAPQVRLRLVQLIRRLYPSPAALPLPFVIDLLGREVFVRGWGPDWLPGVLLEGGVPVSLLAAELMKLITGTAAGGSKAWLTGDLAVFGLFMAAVVFSQDLLSGGAAASSSGSVANANAEVDPESVKKCAAIAEQLGHAQLVTEFGILLRNLAMKG